MFSQKFLPRAIFYALAESAIHHIGNVFFGEIAAKRTVAIGRKGSVRLIVVIEFISNLVRDMPADFLHVGYGRGVLPRKKIALIFCSFALVFLAQLDDAIGDLLHFGYKHVAP